MRTAHDFPKRRTSSSGAGLAFLVGLCAMPFTTVIYGSTLAKLWEWFVTDTFGVLALSTAQAIGLSMVVTFVTYQIDARKDTDDDPLATVLRVALGSVIRAVFALGFGAIVKAFV